MQAFKCFIVDSETSHKQGFIINQGATAALCSFYIFLDSNLLTGCFGNDGEAQCKCTYNMFMSIRRTSGSQRLSEINKHYASILTF